MIEIGKEYKTQNDLKVIIHGFSDINGGEFKGTVYTNKKTNWGHIKKEQCGWFTNGTCIWPLFPEWNLVLPPE